MVFVSVLTLSLSSQRYCHPKLFNLTQCSIDVLPLFPSSSTIFKRFVFQCFDLGGDVYYFQENYHISNNIFTSVSLLGSTLYSIYGSKS